MKLSRKNVRTKASALPTLRFEDTQGRTWQIDIYVEVIKTVKDLL